MANPNQAQKYFRLGLSRSLQSVSDDDVPPDGVSINSFDLLNQTNTTFYTELEFEYTLENTTQSSLETTAILSSNNSSKDKSTLSFTSGETKTLTTTIYVYIDGYYTFTLTVGTNTTSITQRISSF
jgi:hypothetical protein